MNDYTFDEILGAIVLIIIVCVWFFFFNKKKPKNIDDLINNDHTLQKLDKEIGDLNKKAMERLEKDKDAMRILKMYGIVNDSNVDNSTLNNDKKKYLIDFKKFLEHAHNSHDVETYIKYNIENKISLNNCKDKLVKIYNRWREIDELSEINLYGMKKQQLIDFANLKFDLNLKKYLSKQELIDKIDVKLRQLPNKSEKVIKQEINKIKTEIFNLISKILS